VGDPRDLPLVPARRPGGPIRVVARHNAEDVVTLGRILAHLERGYGEGEVRRWAPPGDLVRLARLFRHEGRIDEAVACLEIAGGGRSTAAIRTSPWPRSSWPGCCAAAAGLAEAGVAWSRLVTAPGPLAALGWIELAKEREHRERDLAGAWAATDEALLALYRSRGGGGSGGSPGKTGAAAGAGSDLIHNRWTPN
jgi:hypothetical protein